VVPVLRTEQDEMNRLLFYRGYVGRADVPANHRNQGKRTIDKRHSSVRGRPRTRPLSRQLTGSRVLIGGLAHHHHLGAVIGPFEQVGNVLVVHTNAAMGHEATDRCRIVCAMDGVFGAGESHGGDAHRIVW
jgi:hypothetical protein